AVGVTTVSYTATDSAGNTATCSFNVTVLDNQAPVISGCPGNQTVMAAPGQCAATATWTSPVVSDNCGATLGSTHVPGATFALGTTTVTYTAVDASSNSATCSFTVTVRDDQPPVLSGCPADITVSADPGQA